MRNAESFTWLSSSLNMGYYGIGFKRDPGKWSLLHTWIFGARAFSDTVFPPVAMFQRFPEAS